MEKRLSIVVKEKCLGQYYVKLYINCLKFM